MEKLNMFIDEVMTVDYSYFWPCMEVLDFVQETVIQRHGNYKQLNRDWTTAVFSPFSETAFGKEYVAVFSKNLSPPNLSHELVQNALTELLNLPQEALQRQVDRLYGLLLIWGNCGHKGVLGDYSRLQDAYDLIPGIKLDDFDGWISQWVTTKNLPMGFNKVHLREEFYQCFCKYVREKIRSISKLMRLTGIEPKYLLTIDSGMINEYPSDATTNTEEEDQKDYSRIFIDFDARPKIKKLLSFAINGIEDAANSERFDSLIISGELPKEKIRIKISGKVLANFFGQVVESGAIKREDYTKDYTARWLSYWFSNSKGNLFSEGYLVAEITKDHKNLKNKIKYR